MSRFEKRPVLTLVVIVSVVVEGLLAARPRNVST